MAQTETIDKLLLELSQVSEAKTGRELRLEQECEKLRNAYGDVCGELAEYKAREQPMVIARSSDWVQLYIGGYSVLRGHSIGLTEIMDLFGADYQMIEYTDDEVEEGKAFPTEITGDEIAAHMR